VFYSMYLYLYFAYSRLFTFVSVSFYFSRLFQPPDFPTVFLSMFLTFVSMSCDWEMICKDSLFDSSCLVMIRHAL
jgi:hypothetical protein